MLTRSRSKAAGDYFRSHTICKLQLGAGTTPLKGWFNTDLYPFPPDVFFLDSTLQFPFDDASFDYVFSEHHIEHLTYDEGLFTLQECYRVLKPGGKVRIATPDLGNLLDLRAPERNELQERYIRFIIDHFLTTKPRSYNASFVINNAFKNWGHQFLYDSGTLSDALLETGFTDIVACRPGESEDPHLRAIERHGQFIGNEEINRFETMVAEGVRSY